MVREQPRVVTGVPKQATHLTAVFTNIRNVEFVKHIAKMCRNTDRGAPHGTLSPGGSPKTPNELETRSQDGLIMWILNLRRSPRTYSLRVWTQSESVCFQKDRTLSGSRMSIVGGMRVVVPQTCQKAVLDELYVSHPRHRENEISRSYSCVVVWDG